jgi:hypothetical protein
MVFEEMMAETKVLSKLPTKLFNIVGLDIFI